MYKEILSFSLNALIVIIFGWLLMRSIWKLRSSMPRFLAVLLFIIGLVITIIAVYLLIFIIYFGLNY
ncbi:MAG TPA: hypothetical protein DHV18_00140 [Brochothrix thermosphacta]|nr:hypothetical protein [Brochothrix thermosphacta]